MLPGGLAFATLMFGQFAAVIAVRNDAYMNGAMHRALNIAQD